MYKSNQLWRFFASVKLAIFVLSTIAVTSIIGTIIPQKQSPEFYVHQYGESTARFFQILDIPDMYWSWWFVALLGLLAVNLIVCSIDRFPPVWKQITMKQTSFSPDRLKMMAFSETLDNGLTREEAEAVLKKGGYTLERRNFDDGDMIAGQKGGWTRTGVYIVHLSIIVILIGAVAGYFLGFKGNIMLPESDSTTTIHNSKAKGLIDLGFELRCDFFDIEFYQNGMPKEYTSGLTVIEDGKEVLSKKIEVNGPLKYKGITFYQSSYQALGKNFVISVQHPDEEQRRSFVTPFKKKVEWPEKNLVFGILNADSMQNRVVRTKVWIKEGDKKSKTVTVEPGKKFMLEEGGIVYTVEQMYATGLQVAKDPGVWIVYIGCFLMMFGLYVAFFMSHRRIWIFLPNNRKEPALIAGSANKNKIGFEKTFAELHQTLAGSGSNGRS